MFKNYLKIAFRNINKRKGYSIFNIFALGVCIACCALIILWVNNEFSFNILFFHFTMGNPENALNRPQTIVISETIAHKYFGKKNPIGSMLQVNKEAMEVSGVMKNFPDNTHLKCNMLISLNTLDYDFNKCWGWAAFYSYVKIKQNVSPGQDLACISHCHVFFEISFVNHFLEERNV